jgi:hypothetical protein
VFQNRHWLDQNRRTSVVVKIIHPNLDSALLSSKKLLKILYIQKRRRQYTIKQKVLFEILPFFLCYFSIRCSLAIWAYLRDISLLLFHCKGRICIFKQFSYSDPLTYSYSDPLTYSYSDLITYSDALTYSFMFSRSPNRDA